METTRICPNCRKPLPPDVPLGLCPECLIKAGFPTGTAPGEAGCARFEPPPVEEIARLFPQIEILGFIGKGGMGAVYKARQPALDRVVALKILPPAVADGPGFAERFNREARALARLNHPNIVAVHDFGKTGDLHYLLMEFVDGANLREVERAGRLSPEQALAIVPQICEALQFAHTEGIVHRDIKPENILMDKKGRVKITDFGIAKIIGVPAGEASLTGAKDVMGTPHYMAPEQVEKPQTVDHRADIYSLGVVFYEMLTGELPLGKFAPPSNKAEMDPRLDEVVMHTLEKEPERRYQRASQVKTDVEAITAKASISSPPAVLPSEAPAVNGGESGRIILPAFLLAFFFGIFGAHRFYAGKTRTAILQLCTLGGLAIWAMVDSILILCGAFTDGQGRRITRWVHADPEPNETVSEKIILPAFLLAFFFGVFGAHRFYVGKTRTAVLQLCTLGGLGIWAAIDWILIVCGAFTDGQGLRIANWHHPKANQLKFDVNAQGGAAAIRPTVRDETHARIRSTIMAPGVGLAVAGVLSLFSALQAFGWLDTVFGDIGIDFPFHWSDLSGFGVVVFKLIPALLTLFGAVQMIKIRSYTWAMAATVLAIAFCGLVGLGVGIWALVALLRVEVRQTFANPSNPPIK